MFHQAQKMFELAPFRTAKTLTLDIETAAAPEDVIAQQLENWKAPKTWKPETVESKREEKREEFKAKSSLLDASPIICIACKCDDSAVLFNAMLESSPIENWTVVASKTESEMLQAFGEWADRHIDAQTLICGHNIIGFDLPKLRNAFVRNRLNLPRFLIPTRKGEQANELMDTMKLAKLFSMQHRDDFMISLDTLAAILHLPRPKQVLSGADVPKAYERREYSLITLYCAIDAETTAQATTLMLGQ